MKTTALPIIGSTLFLSADDSNLKNIRVKYSATHYIEAVKGTSPDLRKLSKDQSVCWGDGENYHFRLTLKSQHNQQQPVVIPNNDGPRT